MKLLKYAEIREDGGWVHGVLVEIRPGTEAIVIDDTQLVTAYSKKGGGEVTVQDVQEIWQKYAMGSSSFPDAKEGEDLGRKYGYDPKHFGWENGYDDIEERVVNEVDSEALFQVTVDYVAVEHNGNGLIGVAYVRKKLKATVKDIENLIEAGELGLPSEFELTTINVMESEEQPIQEYVRFEIGPMDMLADFGKIGKA